MAFLIGGANSASGGYEIDNSVRFNQNDHCLTQTFSTSSTSRKKWTFSVWFKRSNLINSAALFTAGASGGNDEMTIRLEGHKIDWQEYDVSASAMDGQLISNNLLRDPTAWYHLVCKWDSTDGTAGDRMKMYLNGVEITSFSTDNNPTQNYDSQASNTVLHNVGRQSWNSASDFDGYMADVNFVNGTALDASYFGERDEDSGIWKPKKPDVSAYGANGFFLEFQQTGTSQNSSGIGADTSGNDNHWAVSNLASGDVTEDTPTNNFATMNPLVYNYANITYSEGNLHLLTGNSENSFTTNTIAPAKGKWYAEIKVTDVGSDALLGITRLPVPVGPNHYSGQQAYDVAYYSANGQKATGGSFSSYGNSYTTNDIVGIAMDLDNDKVYFSKNGTYQNSGDPTSGATGTGAISIPSLAEEPFVFIAVGEWNGSDTSTFEVNFGNPTFSISSGNTDGKYGNFEYAPPSGYYALCTKRLATYG